MPRKSQVVGLATDSEGARTRAYRACESLVCAQCRGAILPESIFSRRSRHVTWAAVGTVTTAPVCVTCRPLRVYGTTNAHGTTGEDHHDG